MVTTNSCQHIISLQNIAATTNAYKVRVFAYTPSTHILSSSVPPGWTQTPQYPTSVTWQLASGGVIPPGNPLPGTFAISVQSNAQVGKRVNIIWLSTKDEVLCSQILFVGCGESADYVLNEAPSTPDGRASAIRDSAFCRCLSAETPYDEDSEQFAEPDLSVELGMPIPAGFLNVSIPYTIEVEPIQLLFNRLWEVTFMDELGDEQPIIVPVVDNLTGLATFTLPQAGEYNFYLTITDPATCVSEKNRDADEYYDVDFTSYRLDGSATQINVNDNVDPCDPRKFEFRDSTDPPGVAPLQWTVTNPGGSTTNLTPVSGIVSYTCPGMTGVYKICLTATDPDSNTLRPQACVTVTPTPKPAQLAFDKGYNSCAAHNFVVTFANLSTTSNCPITWDWDFGDGSPHSSSFSPVHTYVNPGTYNVTLTMTIVGTPNQVVTYSQSIVIAQWTPDITFTICPDGHVTYETTAACNFDWTPWVLHCRRTWDFPGGHWAHIWKHKQKVRVCYDTVGDYGANLTARNTDGGECTETVKVSILSIVRCCPHDKVKIDQPFSYQGKDYRLRTIFKYHGKLPGRIFAKSKLQVRKNNNWRRKRAYTIGVAISGAVFTKDNNGCFGATSHGVTAPPKTHSNRAKVAKWHLPMVGSFQVKPGGLTCTHTVKVDANNYGVTQTNSLWVNDCHCG